MAANDIPILEGPEFKEFWEDHLTNEAKRNIRRSVRRGQGLEDPGLASAAVSLARRYQRIPKFGLALYGVMFAGWILLLAWLMSIPSVETVGFMRIIAGLWIVLSPIRLAMWWLVQRPRYQRSEQHNIRTVAAFSQSREERSH